MSPLAASSTDQQLLHFQTKFLTTNVKGTEREMYLPVNFDIDPLPHLRPPQIPTTVLNHPPLVRMENHSLAPLAEKLAKYQVPGDLIKKPGKYRSPSACGAVPSRFTSCASSVPPRQWSRL